MRVFLNFADTIHDLLHDAEFRALGALLTGLIATGTIFYSFVEGWDLIDSLYFCVITSATVGYGDLTPQTDLGKLFTIPYVLVSVGLLVAFFGQVARGMISQRMARVSSNEKRDAGGTDEGAVADRD